MSTLIEKSAEPASKIAPAHVLHSRHRWERWRGVSLALLIGLTLTLIAVLIVHFKVPTAGLVFKSLLWTGGLVVTGIAAALAWRWAPDSLVETARLMDQKHATKNRLEAAAALHQSSTPLARAQREETAAYLETESRVRPVRILPWLLGGVALLIALHLLTLASLLDQPSLPKAAPTPPPTQAPPRATIVWKTPEPETKANPIEEVPTVAIAQSSTGLTNLSLEVSVNGEPKKSTPLPAHPFDQSGKHPVKSSIYLDELNVDPFDVVSYYLRAQRITTSGAKLADITSPIQFVQVRRFREDVGQGHASPTAEKADELLIELKLAQLRSIKENFILAHTDLPVTDPTRRQENGRVGNNQALLATKTGEAIQFFIEKGLPAEMIDLLQQAQPLMADAGKKILAVQNSAALPVQEKALNRIIEVEKLFMKSIGEPASGNPGLDDPFKDKQLHELSKRFDSAAGKLEQLAKNQSKLADDLQQGNSTPSDSNPSAAPAANSTPSPGASPASPGTSPGQPGVTPTPPSDGLTPSEPGQSVPLPTAQTVDPFSPDSGNGTPTERETRVVQGVETLLNTNTVLPPKVVEAMQQAQKDATAALHQLDLADEAGAREPAAAAAEDLQVAVNEMNKAGEEQTKAAMAQAQQQLNDQARQLRDLAKNAEPAAQQKGLSDVANHVHDTQNQLNQAADQQQDSGSSHGAQQLNHLANQITNQNIARDLGQMSQHPLDPKQAEALAQRLEALAGNAASAQTGGQPTAQDIARLVNALEASRTNLAHLAQAAGAAPAPSHPNGSPGPPPGATPSGQSPGSQPQASGQGQTPGQDQGQAQTPAPGQGQGPGQGKGPDEAQGQKPGEDPGATGQADQAGGQHPEQGSGGEQAQDSPQTHGGQGGNQTANPPAPDAQGNGGSVTENSAKAYRELLADVKAALQQSSILAPQVQTGNVERQLNDAMANGFRQVTPQNMVHAYQAIAPPLDKLIADLRSLASTTEREDVVTQPNLDEAPVPYRAAVSDYFESMSRDYHPDDADADAKKP